MSDSNWLRNLAEARLVNGVWLLKNPDESRNQAEGELADIVPTLMRDTDEACQVFNLYRGQKSDIKILPLRAQHQGIPYGFVLLLGTVQLKLEYGSGILTQTQTHLSQYEKQERLTCQYLPYFDSFGGLSWKSEAESIMTRQQLVKKILSDVCRLYCLATGRNQIENTSMISGEQPF